MNQKIKDRLEYLRAELRAERISYGELAELSSLVDHIDLSDVELLEPAGVPEGTTAISYHVFTHNSDDWFDTYDQARAYYDELVADDNDARLYIEYHDDSELISEDCLCSHGNYPM